MRYFILLLLTAFLLSLTAQTKYNSHSKYYWDRWDDWEFEFELDYDRPFIELNYGFGDQSHEKFNGDLPEVGLIELKLGYLKERSYDYGILDDRFESFVFGSKISPNLSSTELNNEFESTVWRFGFATRNTLGYNGEYVSVLPYHQDGFAWSRLETPDNYPAELTPQMLLLLSEEAQEDYQIVERYRDAFRFGTVVEGGIRVEFADFVSLNAGYEASVIFPRHLFWKQAGSYIIERAGQGALTYFINEVTESTPEAGPIVRFLLLNAYSYGFHVLKQKDMNWPFDTETPMTFETFKVGVTFTF